MKRLFVALCLILILPLLLAQYTVIDDYPDLDRLRDSRLKTREVKPTLGAKVGSRTLDSLRGLG